MSFFHDLVKHQMIGGSFTTLIRWQSHAYVLRQSLGFFQNDFAGRVANKVMQSGPAVRESVVQAIDAVWFVAVYWLTAVVLFAQADLWLVTPLAGWFLAYVLVLRYFIPRLKARAIETSEARSMLTGRIVDSYTNILTVKLFAHTEREDAYAKSAMRGTARQAAGAAQADDADGDVAVSVERAVARRHVGLGNRAVEPTGGNDRRHRAGDGPHHPHREHVRLGHVDGGGIFENSASRTRAWRRSRGPGRFSTSRRRRFCPCRRARSPSRT